MIYAICISIGNTPRSSDVEGWRAHGARFRQGARFHATTLHTRAVAEVMAARVLITSRRRLSTPRCTVVHDGNSEYVSS